MVHTALDIGLKEPEFIREEDFRAIIYLPVAFLRVKKHQYHLCHLY